VHLVDGLQVGLAAALARPLPVTCRSRCWPRLGEEPGRNESRTCLCASVERSPPESASMAAWSSPPSLPVCRIHAILSYLEGERPTGAANGQTFLSVPN
jgi:hypothetical protein